MIEKARPRHEPWRRSLVAIALSSCATAAPEVPEREDCRSDDDCGPGEVCALEQGGLCVDASTAQRASFALRLQEPESSAIPGFVDLLGCDTQANDGDFVLVPKVALEALSRTVSLQAQRVFGRGLDNPNHACPSDYTYNDEANYCIANAAHGAVKLSLTTPSTATMDTVGETAVSDEKLPETPVQIRMVPDLDVGTLVRVDPGGPHAEAYGFLYHLIDPKHAELFDNNNVVSLVSDWRCHWPIVSRVRAAGPSASDPPVWLGDANVKFYYQTAIANGTTLPLVDNDPLSTICESVDSVCRPDYPAQVCDVKNRQCVLDLNALLAAEKQSSIEPEALGTVRTRLYSYCAPDWVDQRDLEVRVEPPAQPLESPVRYPSVRLKASARLTVEPSDPSIPVPDIPLSRDICVPAWTSLVPKLEFEADPVPLRIGPQTRHCCTTDCLNSDERRDGADGDDPETCDSLQEMKVRLTFDTSVRNDTTDLWPEEVADTCLAAGAPEGEVVGSFTVSLADASCTDSPCPVALAVPRAATESARTYTLTVRPDASSVFRSQRRSVLVRDGETIAANLQPRPVIVGRVVCRDGFLDCQASSAEVLAERLNVADDDDAPAPLGPFFYSDAANTDGDFALPVNPGVYILTALPQQGVAGGPAPYRILDLRLASEGGTLPDLGPVTIDVGNLLQLEPGRTVRVRLGEAAAERRLSVRAIDFGSWTGQLSAYWFPESRPQWLVDPTDHFWWPTPIDLNDPQTCLQSEVTGPTGCTIRRLTAQGAPLKVAYGGVVQFTARAAIPSLDNCE